MEKPDMAKVLKGKVRAPSADVLIFSEYKRRAHDSEEKRKLNTEEIEVFCCLECGQNCFYITVKSEVICNHCLKPFDYQSILKSRE